MTDQRGNTAATEESGERFALAYSNFSQLFDLLKDARRKHDEAQVAQTEAINALPEEQRADMEQLAAIADRLKIQASGDAVFKLLDPVESAFKEMMWIAAPTSFALSLKLIAIKDYEPDEAQYYIDRLIADAANTSFQFAEVWLAHWRAHGGCVQIGPRDRLSCFHPTFSLSPDAAALEARQQQAGLPLEPHQRSWHAAFFDGQMRVLGDLLDEMPGARQTLKAMIETNPAKGEPTPEAIAAAQREGA